MSSINLRLMGTIVAKFPASDTKQEKENIITALERFADECGINSLGTGQVNGEGLVIAAFNGPLNDVVNFKKKIVDSNIFNVITIG